MKKTLLSLSVLVCLLLTGNLAEAQYITGRLVTACNQGYPGAVRLDLPNSVADGYAYADANGYWTYFIGDPSNRGTIYLNPELGGGSGYAPASGSIYINPTQSNAYATYTAQTFTTYNPELANFKINGTDVTTFQYLSTDACDTNPIVFTNNLNPRGSQYVPSRYIITLYETNIQGSVQGNFIGSTGDQPYNGLLNYDLRSLIPTSLTNPYIMVKFETKSNYCSNTWISKVGRFTIIKLNAQANFIVNAGNGSSSLPIKSLPGFKVTPWGASVSGSNSSGSISTYSIIVDEVTSSGAFVKNVVNYLNQPVPGGNPSNLSAINLNQYASPQGYFASAFCTTFKVRLQVNSQCGMVEEWGYIQVEGPNCRIAGPGDEVPLPPGGEGSRINIYPNPTTSTTTINFDLDKTSKVTLGLVDITGKEVSKIINNETKNAGFHEASLDMSKLPNGIYLYKLLTGDEIKTGKIVKN